MSFVNEHWFKNMDLDWYVWSWRNWFHSTWGTIKCKTCSSIVLVVSHSLLPFILLQDVSSSFFFLLSSFFFLLSSSFFLLFQDPVKNIFDSHICFAAASPIKMKDGSARVYYMGGNGPHNGARNTSLALATLKSWEHFAGLSGTGNVTLTKLKVTGKFLTFFFCCCFHWIPLEQNLLTNVHVCLFFFLLFFFGII